MKPPSFARTVMWIGYSASGSIILTALSKTWADAQKQLVGGVQPVKVEIFNASGSKLLQVWRPD